jgi:ribonuclease P protein subunit RPR2
MVAIAKERIDILFSLAAQEAAKKDLARADRYASLAVKLGMRYNVRLPKEFRLRFCRGCGSYLVPGANLRVRLRNGKRVMTCGRCGRERRMPYKERGG